MPGQSLTLKEIGRSENGNKFTFHYAAYQPPDGERLEESVRAICRAVLEIGLPVGAVIEGVAFAVTPEDMEQNIAFSGEAGAIENKIRSVGDMIAVQQKQGAEDMTDVRTRAYLQPPEILAAAFITVEKARFAQQQAREKGAEGWQILHELRHRDDAQMMRAISLMGEAYNKAANYPATAESLASKMVALGYRHIQAVPDEIAALARDKTANGPEHRAAFAEYIAGWFAYAPGSINGRLADRWLQIYGAQEAPAPVTRSISNAPGPRLVAG